MKRNIFIIIMALLCLWQGNARAFWGSDAGDAGSGLNVADGFDVNTIVTVTGTVVSLPERKGQEQHAVMTVAAPQGNVSVVLGPWWYWETVKTAIAGNQVLTVTGSMAQGKDGVLYLFAQRLENRTSGESLTLRSETGKPLWSRSSGGRQTDGNVQRSGYGSRGSGSRGGRR